MPPHRTQPTWLTYVVPILTALMIGAIGGMFRMYTQVQLLQWREDFYHGTGGPKP